MGVAVPFAYDPPPAAGAIRQGEVLAGVWEYRLLVTGPAREGPYPVRSIEHPLVIALTADCDLAQDFTARSRDPGARSTQLSAAADETDSALVPYTLFCDLYMAEALRSRVSGSDVWRRIRQNQDERYHTLVARPIWDQQITDNREIIMDFKKLFAIPTGGLYQNITAGHIHRLALVPPVYLHDLMHRFYGFLSRVGLPD
jgi:hypothetical protein